MTSTALHYQTPVTQVSCTQKELEPLDRSILWGHPHRILPLLGKLTTQLPVKLVGVEELPPKRRGGYQSFPRRLTFEGDYEGFAELLAVVQEIRPSMRIDELLFHERQRYPGTLRLSLTVAPMQREEPDDTMTAVEVLPFSHLEMSRNPFVF